MSTHERTDAEIVLALRDWLEQGVAALPDGMELPAPVRRHLITQLPTTPQRRRWWSDRWSTRGRRAVHGDDVHGSRDNGRSNRMFGFAALLMAGAVGTGVLVAGVNQQASAPPPIVVAQDGSGDVLTITEGVALAQDGDTVLVRPGTYTESVVIDKDITVRGDGDRAAIIIEGTAGTATEQGPHSLVLADSDATLAGLTIQGMAGEVRISGGAPTLEDMAFHGTGVPYGSTDPCTDERGCGGTILITDGSHATVRDSVFVGGADFMVDGDADPLIEGNELRDGPQFYLADPGDAAIVRNNAISGTFDRAIGVFAPTTMLIEANDITDPRGDGITVGWQYAPGVDPIIRGNVIHGAGVGINVQPKALPTIESNEILGGSSGILLYDSSAVVRQNTVRDHRTVGISVSGGTPIIDGNTIEGAKFAFIILSGAAPTLTGNLLCDNEVDYRVGVGRDDLPLPDGNTVCDIVASAAPSAAP